MLPHEPARGAAPGTLQIESDAPPRIFVMDFGLEHLQEHELEKIDDVIPYLDKESITWIDIRGIGHQPTYERLGEIFKIHPLALEDIVNVPQRPKSDVYDDQQLIITRMVNIHEGGLTSEQMSILFGKGFVVTVQEEPDVDCLDPLRARIRAGRGQIRKIGADYVAYALLDTVIDGFYPVLEHYGELLDELELRVLSSKAASSNDIFALKRELLALRRAAWPQRDLLAGILREDSPHITPETRIFLRDTYDHSVQIMDMVETFREIASSLMDLLMTGVSNRLNETMKVLTVVSSIFLPMTFVAGIYGMNFNPESSPYNMPELNWHYGYPFSFALMAVSAATLLLYYRSRGLIGSKGDAYSQARRLLKGKPRKKAKK
ncbi:MAG: magnesium/cobalt transporter CorA [Polyangiaceae bacterium]|nr:magnesium/cobalt transporter CorA [Polyangiaceae bacterium]